MSSRFKWQNLPRPDAIHHIVEDFLTKWDSQNSHILPFRRFVENVIDQDMRYFFGEDCLVLGLTHQSLPFMCHHHLHQGLLADAEIGNQFSFVSALS